MTCSALPIVDAALVYSGLLDFGLLDLALFDFALLNPALVDAALVIVDVDVSPVLVEVDGDAAQGLGVEWAGKRGRELRSIFGGKDCRHLHLCTIVDVYNKYLGFGKKGRWATSAWITIPNFNIFPIESGLQQEWRRCVIYIERMRGTGILGDHTLSRRCF
eukprot:1333450-Amorphochlora_amoeboformis.AAC.1